MKKAIRRSVISLVLAAGSLLPMTSATPAYACNGDPCDGFCNFWTWDSGNTKVNNLTPGDCPIR